MKTITSLDRGISFTMDALDNLYAGYPEWRPGLQYEYEPLDHPEGGHPPFSEGTERVRIKSSGWDKGELIVLEMESKRGSITRPLAITLMGFNPILGEGPLLLICDVNLLTFSREIVFNGWHETDREALEHLSAMRNMRYRHEIA